MTAKQLAAKDKVSVRTVFRSVQYFHAVDKIANSLGHRILDTILAGDVKLSQRDALRLARVQPDALAHAWEESGQGRRNKGPIPPSILPAYLGP